MKPTKMMLNRDGRGRRAAAVEMGLDPVFINMSETARASSTRSPNAMG
jgi:hypothetical protein